MSLKLAIKGVLTGFGLAIATGGIFPTVAIAVETSCDQDLETVVELLLEDLPGYTNRVIQRSRLSGTNDHETYVITTGQPEFEPLALVGSTRALPISPDDPKQVFFTTLEQSFSGDRAIPRENYHWLFLVSSPDGWRMATLFTRYGSVNREQPPSPPREASNGAIGQAVRLWLRDCRFSPDRKKQN
ncbi:MULTISPECIES: hypothetical protein [Spirulina sp. CCY15215]|uniref:hypothetical protein n=1 Tax=Spirulina sp. CCY15215 TaxID=2767591 RepID=UPI0032AEA324